MSKDEGTQADPKVLTVEIRLCELCLSGAGGECHAPGCALWLKRAPDIAIDQEFYKVVNPRDGATSSRGDQPAFAREESVRWPLDDERGQAQHAQAGMTIREVLAKDAPPMPPEWWDAWFEKNGPKKSLGDLPPEETMAAVERAVAEWSKRYAGALLEALETP